jgi:hypothetical protein
MARAERRAFEAVIEEGRSGGALVDGEPYRGSIAPMGGGRHVLGISKAIRAAIGKDVGDSVKVVLEHDSEPRTVETPPDLRPVDRGGEEAGDACAPDREDDRDAHFKWMIPPTMIRAS